MSMKLTPSLTRLAALLLAGSLGISGFAGEAGFAQDERFADADEAREVLAEGVNLYRAGRSEEAAVKLRDALKLKPDNKLIYEFYLAVGDRLLWEMQEDDRLEDVLKDIRRKAWIYQKQLRRSDEYILILIAKLEAASEDERLVATNELVAVGPLAVPHLVAKLGDNRQDDLRINARVVLTKMGYRAVVPLCEALNAADERLVGSVATVLADIGDARALPKLLHLQESSGSETVRRVCANTVAAIQRNAGTAQAAKPAAGAKDAAPTAAAPAAGGDRAYFVEGLRYFRDGGAVRDEMIANESLMWRWDEAGEGAKKLGYQRVPRYAWNELMAEELLYDGAVNYPEFAGYYPLIAATLSAQDVEATQRHALAKERTTPERHPDEALDAIAERVKDLGEIGHRVLLAGPEHLYRAVQQSIVSERYDVAVYLMRALQDRYLTDADRLLPSKVEGLTSDKPGTVLVAALDHGEKMVRYAAATTLAHLDPTLQFFNAEKVIPNLSDAVGEWGMRVVAVVDQDYRQRNTARDQLQRQGYLVVTCENGFELMQRLEESPIKDAIIIAGDLLPELRDEYGSSIDVPEQRAITLVEKLKKDWRAEKTPIIISTPENPKLAADIQTALEGKVEAFVAKPFNGTELEGAIENALKTAQLPNVNREQAEDVSRRAAVALAAVDPARSQFDLAAAGPALIETIDSRADTLRVESLRALGIAAQAPGGASIKGQVARVADVYGTQDATLPADVRAAFVYALGQLDPLNEAAFAILKKAMQHDDAAVRAEAHRALGHADQRNDALIRDALVQQRLDQRKSGAGKDEDLGPAGALGADAESALGAGAGAADAEEAQ
ncbi:MAG TPA: HEAT repeat domain-containing protein [Planctomycetota bacterium]|nr:HEAT repeat domain-containing protein [Planctomycetota bacterium]